MQTKSIHVKQRKLPRFFTCVTLLVILWYQWMNQMTCACVFIWLFSRYLYHNYSTFWLLEFEQTSGLETFYSKKWSSIVCVFKSYFSLLHFIFYWSPCLFKSQNPFLNMHAVINSSPYLWKCSHCASVYVCAFTYIANCTTLRNNNNKSINVNIRQIGGIVESISSQTDTEWIAGMVSPR